MIKAIFAAMVAFVIGAPAVFANNYSGDVTITNANLKSNQYRVTDSKLRIRKHQKPRSGRMFYGIDGRMSFLLDRGRGTNTELTCRFKKVELRTGLDQWIDFPNCRIPGDIDFNQVHIKGKLDEVKGKGNCIQHVLRTKMDILPVSRLEKPWSFGESNITIFDSCHEVQFVN